MTNVQHKFIDICNWGYTNRAPVHNFTILTVFWNHRKFGFFAELSLTFFSKLPL